MGFGITIFLSVYVHSTPIMSPSPQESTGNICSVGDIPVHGYNNHIRTVMSRELQNDIANYCETMETLNTCFESPATASYPLVLELVRFVVNMNASPTRAAREQYYTILVHRVSNDCARYSISTAIRRLWCVLSHVQRYMYLRACVSGTTYLQLDSR